MIAYIVRRTLYMIPVLIGVIAITLFLFFVVSDDPVLQYAGRVPSKETLQALREKYELDAPVFISRDYLTGEDVLKARRADALQPALAEVAAAAERGEIAQEQAESFITRWADAEPGRGDDEEVNRALTELGMTPELHVDFDSIELGEREAADVAERSVWDSHFFRVLRFDFADSMMYPGENIWTLLKRKAPVTLRVTAPMLFIGLAIELTLALIAASRRARPLDSTITILAVFTMSVPFLSYIVAGQWLAAETNWFPVSGYASGWDGVRYLAFPVAIGVIAGVGGGVRFYRAVLLEEIDRDYVRTARAKGVSQNDVLFIHVLRNAGIPIITRLSVIIPFLITGSLLIERNFELPGVGDLMLSAIGARDFWIVMPLTYLLALFYALTVLLTDVVYAVVDPRVRVSD